MATPDDLAETVKVVEALDRRIVAARGRRPRRRRAQAAFDAGVAELGRVDIVLANAGIAPTSRRATPRASVAGRHRRQPHRRLEHRRGRDPADDRARQGGAIVLTSSTAGINGIGGPTRGGLGYTAAKHGVVGLMRPYANKLAPHSIRVNTRAPDRREHRR